MGITGFENPPSRGIVLVADDDDDVRLVLTLRFAQLGYDVVPASNGAQLIAELDAITEMPLAIFVDLVMPGMPGASVIEYLKHEARFADIPTAIVTASPELAPAGYQVFTKPVRFELLCDFVQQSASRALENARTQN